MTARRAFFLAAAGYVLAPGAPGAFLHGVPLGLWPLIALVSVVFVWAFFRDEQRTSNRWRQGVAGLAVLTAVKLVVWSVTPAVGWLGSYYASADFSGRVRRSTEFARLDATRIDRAIVFRDDYFPAYFLNEADFNRGDRREVTEPVTVRWVGHVSPSAATPLYMALAVRGRATVSVDGLAVLEATTASGRVEQTVTLAPGDREVVVAYLKTRDTDPLIELHGVGDEPGHADVIVTPRRVPSWRRTLIRPAALVSRIIDGGAVLLFAFVAWPLLIGFAAGRHSDGTRLSVPRVLAAAMLVLLVAQGVQTVSPWLHRAMPLSGGDDWLAYEARAREVITGGPLMRFGLPLFTGEAFYYYPGYAYFLGVVHWLAGEDLAMPVFVHFLVLFAANLVVYRIAVTLFDAGVGTAGVAALMAIEELAFIRHYTVTLLTENLYFLTVPLTLYALIRYLQTRARHFLVWAGIAGGFSSIVRPAMMIFFVPAVLLVLMASWRRSFGLRASVAATALFVMCWFVPIAPMTLRNYLVAGQPVLISMSPTHSFVLYNLPSTNAEMYRTADTGGFLSALRVMFRITREQPLDMWRNITTKIGFSFGLIQWMGGHIHPELLAASAGYLLAIACVPEARAFVTWPIHAFVLAHLAGLVLTMPSNYGYRLILPMYLFFPLFASRLLFGLIRRFRPAPDQAHGPNMGSAHA